MRKLASYLCHRASVRLHEAAVGLLGGEQNLVVDAPTVGICRGNCSRLCMCGEDANLTLHDVAPRLSAAIEAVGDRVQHAKWLAGIVGLERITRNR